MTLPAAITAIIKSNGEDFVAWSCGTLLSTTQLGATTPYNKVFTLRLSITTNIIKRDGYSYQHIHAFPTLKQRLPLKESRFGIL